MPEKPLPEDLQAVLRQALQAYELARVTRWRAEQEAHAAHQGREQSLAEEEKAEPNAWKPSALLKKRCSRPSRSAWEPCRPLPKPWRPPPAPCWKKPG